MYTNREFKRTAMVAIESWSGMKPKMSDITLLEASDDRTYIRFAIKGCEYVFSSYVCDKFIQDGKEVECVWCGPNTIERIGFRK